MPPVFQLTRNGQPLASLALGPELQLGDEAASALVNELQPCGFQLNDREPDMDYRLRLGDRDPASFQGDASPLGVGRGRTVFWDEALHFDGARGRVWVHLESRALDAAGPWAPRARLPVYVTATKLAQERYDTMLRQLRHVAAGLLLDLVSPMLRSLRFGAPEGGVSDRSSQVELRLLDRLWRTLAPPLREIGVDPVTRLDRRWVVRLSWGGGRFGARTLGQLAARGHDPRRPGMPRPFPALREHFTESVDTVEHRVLAGLLVFLRERVAGCVRNIAAHTQGIDRDRPLRERAPAGGPSLYELEDVPRLRQLEAARQQAGRLLRRLRQAQALRPLRGRQPQFSLPMTPVFEHVRPYRRIRDAFNRYLHSSLILLEDGFEERLKSTQRMYEQWVFFQIAAGLRHAGLRCVSREGLFHRAQRFRFTLDVDRGARLTFTATDGRALVLRFEPWILPSAAAQQRRDSVYRGTRGDAAWSPDVLLEFLGTSQAEGTAPEVEYAVVVDAKYTRRIQEHHWADTRKYQDIRATRTRRQVVKQLWLAYPSEDEHLELEDTAVTWTAQGPDCGRDDFISGRLGLIPARAEPALAARAPGWISVPERTTCLFLEGLLNLLGIPHTPLA